jgi:predicted Zn-ribbon and HTH transcriptional regulator
MGSEVVSMAKVTCSICGYSFEQEDIGICPDCSSYVCEECSYMYRGHCSACYQEVTLDFDE